MIVCAFFLVDTITKPRWVSCGCYRTENNNQWGVLYDMSVPAFSVEVGKMWSIIWYII